MALVGLALYPGFQQASLRTLQRVPGNYAKVLVAACIGEIAPLHARFAPDCRSRKKPLFRVGLKLSHSVARNWRYAISHMGHISAM
ncbi:MAG: hypothetical protein LAT78_15185 [Roseinatronobacter sp.]|nr:hypothetical protein [Roseinatronobacter sp.]